MDKDWLYNEYVVKDRSTKSISEEYGCKRNTIQCWLYKFGIKKEIKHHEMTYNKPYQNKGYLIEQHIINKKSIAQIAKENNVSGDCITHFCKKFGVKTWRTCPTYKLTQEDINKVIELYRCGVSTYRLSQYFGVGTPQIRKYLKLNNIEIRNIKDSYYVNRTTESNEKLYNKEWLQQQHFVLNKSCKQLAKELNCDPNTVRRHMKNLGITPKNNSQSKIRLLIGDKHPNWKGGITPLNLLLREYFQTNLIPKILKRDNYTCQECGIKYTQLHVHHIKKFSEITKTIMSEHSELNAIDNKYELYLIIVNDKRFLDLDNLITLCKQCHINKHKTISSQTSNNEGGSETIP